MKDSLELCTDGLSEMGKEKLMILKRVAPLGSPANFIPTPNRMYHLGVMKSTSLSEFCVQ